MKLLYIKNLQFHSIQPSTYFNMLKFHFNSTSPRFWNRFDSYRINLETIKKTIVGTIDND